MVYQFLFLGLWVVLFGLTSQAQTCESAFEVLNGPKFRVDYKDVTAAEDRVRAYLEPTSLVKSKELSDLYGANVYFKLETETPIGAFKIRGALNAMLQLSPVSRQRGVITASSGNHAQGVAWAARELGIQATVVMAENTPHIKVEKTKALGAQVILRGHNFGEAKDHAEFLSQKGGQEFIHPFEDKNVIAGQGTIALEVLRQVPGVDVVVGAMGGGGLMTGIGTVLKKLSPHTVTVGVQANNASPLARHLSGLPARTETLGTLADGAAVHKASSTMKALVENVVDFGLKMNEDSIADAIRLHHQLNLPAEGAGSLPLAALPQAIEAWRSTKPQVESLRPTVVLVVSGKNIDSGLLKELLAEVEEQVVGDRY